MEEKKEICSQDLFCDEKDSNKENEDPNIMKDKDPLVEKQECILKEESLEQLFHSIGLTGLGGLLESQRNYVIYKDEEFIYKYIEFCLRAIHGEKDLWLDIVNLKAVIVSKGPKTMCKCVEEMINVALSLFGISNIDLYVFYMKKLYNEETLRMNDNITEGLFSAFSWYFLNSPIDKSLYAFYVILVRGWYFDCDIKTYKDKKIYLFEDIRNRIEKGKHIDETSPIFKEINTAVETEDIGLLAYVFKLLSCCFKNEIYYLKGKPLSCVDYYIYIIEAKFKFNLNSLVLPQFRVMKCFDFFLSKYMNTYVDKEKKYYAFCMTYLVCYGLEYYAKYSSDNFCFKPLIQKKPAILVPQCSIAETKGFRFYKLGKRNSFTETDLLRGENFYKSLEYEFPNIKFTDMLIKTIAERDVNCSKNLKKQVKAGQIITILDYLKYDNFYF